MEKEKKTRLNKEITERIKTRREEIGDSNFNAIRWEDLSVKCGLNRTSLQSILRGDRMVTQSEIKNIAKGLNVSVDWLICGNGEVYPCTPVISATEKLRKQLLWGVREYIINTDNPKELFCFCVREMIGMDRK